MNLMIPITITFSVFKFEIYQYLISLKFLKKKHSLRNSHLQNFHQKSLNPLSLNSHPLFCIPSLSKINSEVGDYKKSHEDQLLEKYRGKKVNRINIRLTTCPISWIHNSSAIITAHVSVRRGGKLTRHKIVAQINRP